jgi:hypothetical protein
MLRLLRLSFGPVPRLVCSRSDLLLENSALRQQLLVLRARHPKPRLRAPDKLFWVLARRHWPNWKHSLATSTSTPQLKSQAKTKAFYEAP